MPQRLPCSASVLLTTVSTCSNHSWTSGRASRVKRSLWPPASSSAHTQPPLLQTWALSSCANMSRYQITENIVIFKTWRSDFCLRNINELTVLLLPLGTCCWCVWSLLPAVDWNGAPTAISDQEDCWHQPTYSTSCLWPFLVLLSVWSKRLSESLVWFSFSDTVTKDISHKFATLILSELFSSVSDDSTNAFRQEASQKVVAVHLRLKGKISSAEGSAHPWLPCPQHQEAPGGARHLPPGWCGHSNVWLSSTVWHTHQSGECFNRHWDFSYTLLNAVYWL